MDLLPNWPDLNQAAATIAVALFLAALGYAALRDVRTLTVPNALVGGLLLVWVVFAPIAGLSSREMALDAGSAAMVFFATVAAYAMGWMGGGDSKLLTVSSLWLGAGQVVPFLMATMLAGGGLALGIVALRLLPRNLPFPDRFAPAEGAARELPYALAIALGALTVLPRTSWLGAL
ncbi:A24 family peptidase [Paragemmobacter straminiformis]|uniref:Prepilin peptidase n=1 Tax=Paragemmobacter straminiformis TaxID=2045119 RepID=A0A842I879_9RHOB|nr:prepilin peptidase [Gemmobacter straminiformis]MBC2835781.1 prepilin peptidase [Gemmobacter straminiformis]